MYHHPRPRDLKSNETADFGNTNANLEMCLPWQCPAKSFMLQAVVSELTPGEIIKVPHDAIKARD